MLRGYNTIDVPTVDTPGAAAYTPRMELQYRDWIKNKLAERCSRNESYSLRAFARDLGFEVSQLSRVLNGKQQLSNASSRLVAEKLFEQPLDREIFLLLVEFETTKRPALRELALKKLEELQTQKTEVPLQVEAFRVISEWYHVAILDLTWVKPTRSTPAQFAQALGITELEARLALERLEKLGLIERKGKRWVKTQARLTLPSGPSSQSVRKFHQQMIGKSLESVEGQSADRRYLRADTLSVRSQDLPKIRELIDEFSKSIRQFAHSPGDKDELYQFNMQLFSLINTKEKKK